MIMQYKISGKGAPVILVPGGLTGWNSWEPHAIILSEKHTVVRVQLLNVQYGLEDRDLPPDYSIRTESEALSETLDSLGYHSQIDIAGWSYGAFTSLQFALDHPERIRTLTLIEPPAMWLLRYEDKFDEDVQKEADFFMSLKGNITEEMLENFLIHAGFIKTGQSARELPQWNKWVNFRQSLRHAPAVVEHFDNKNRLRKIQVPVLLVKGTGSTAWLHQIIDELEKNISHSSLVELPSGHGPHLISMNEFLLELEKFIYKT